MTAAGPNPYNPAVSAPLCTTDTADMSAPTVPTASSRGPSRGRAVLALVAVAAVLAAAGGLWARHHQRYKHVAVHEPGMVYRSAWVEPDVMAELIEKHQIRTVVNLCAPGEMGEHRWAAERDAVRNAGATLLELSLPHKVEVTDGTYAPHLAALADPNNYPMLVHCQHGVTRTCRFLAIYDIAFRGKTAEQTLAAQPLFGRDEQNVNVRAFCREFEKRHAELYPQASAERLAVLRN